MQDPVQLNDDYLGSSLPWSFHSALHPCTRISYTHVTPRGAYAPLKGNYVVRTLST